MNAQTFVMMSFALATGCSVFQHDGDVGDYVYPPAIDLYDGPVVGVITGQVNDVDGYAIANLPVTLADGREALTDQDGVYRFDDVEPGTWMVKVSVIEYAEQFRKVVIDDWETETASFELYPTSVVWQFDNAEGGLFQEGRAILDVPPFAFSRPGEPAEGGDVQLALTVPDLLETGIQGAPGDFLTYDENGDAQLMASYGFWDIRVFQDGQEINVASDAAVGLTYELWDEDEMPAMQKGTLRETMPLWWFDGEQGGWVLEDEIEIVEDQRGQRSVTAEMTHFTPWNCDDLFAASCVEVLVSDQMGNGIEGASVVLAGNDFASGTGATTDDSGIAVVWGMPGGTANIIAQLMVRDRPYTEMIDLLQIGAPVPLSAGSVCPVQVEIELPVCMVGGDVQLNVNNYYSKDEGGNVEQIRLPSGVGMFYAPSGEFGACADPLGEDMEPGDWTIIEPTEEDPDLFEPEDYVNVEAGDVVRVTDDDEVAVDLMVDESTETDNLYVVVDDGNDPEVVGDLLTDGSTLDIVVQGAEGGLPGFEVEDVIELSVAPEVENAGEGLTYTPGDDMQLELLTPSADPIFVSVLTEEGEMVLGKFDAGETPTLPDWVTEKMSQNSTVTLFGQKVGYVQAPNGTYIRTTTQNSTVVNVTAE